jgi:hypothetical protein
LEKSLILVVEQQKVKRVDVPVSQEAVEVSLRAVMVDVHLVLHLHVAVCCFCWHWWPLREEKQFDIHSLAAKEKGP